jgi:1-acyl-sn-glycerol-3-phosphate acyltransferase
MHNSSDTSPFPDSNQCIIPSRKTGFILRVIKITWLGLGLSIATFLVFPIITLSSLITSTGNFAFNLSRLWAWFLLTITRVRVTIRGKKKIAKATSYVIIANHQSHFDGPALATALGIQFRWIAKKELLKIPLFGQSLYAARNIFIDRSNRVKAIESLQAGMDRIPKGVSVMCFAEGTRSHRAKINGFKKGGFVAALKKGLPILPVTVNGSAKILPRDSIVFRSGRIQIVVDDPIETKGLNLEDVDALMSKTRDTIISNYLPDYPEK